MTTDESSSTIHTRFALASVAFLIPVVAVFSSKAMVPLLGLLFLSLVFYGNKGGLDPREWPRLPLLGFILLIALGAASSQWSVAPDLSLRVIGPIAALAAIGLITVAKTERFSPEEAQVFSAALACGVAVALVVVLFEAATLSWITRQIKGITWPDVLSNVAGSRNLEALLKDGLTLLSLFIWPAMFYLAGLGRRLWAGVAWFVLLGSLYHFGAGTALLAILTGSAVALAARWRPRLVGQCLAGLFLMSVLLMPILIKPVTAPAYLSSVAAKAGTENYSSSGFARLNIWQFTADKIGDRPVLGWGMNSSRNIPDGDQKRDVYQATEAGGQKLIYRDFNLPLHPHNQALQIWLELGALGAILIAVFGGLMIWRVAVQSQEYKNAPYVYALVVSILAFNFLSFGAWQNWWVAAQFLSFILLIAARRAFAYDVQTD